MSIQDLYFTVKTLWDQLALTELVELSAFAPYITYKESQHLVQFLWPYVVILKVCVVQLFHHSPLPFSDDVVNELLAKEIILAF